MHCRPVPRVFTWGIQWPDACPSENKTDQAAHAGTAREHQVRTNISTCLNGGLYWWSLWVDWAQAQTVHDILYTAVSVHTPKDVWWAELTMTTAEKELQLLSADTVLVLWHRTVPGNWMRTALETSSAKILSLTFSLTVLSTTVTGSVALHTNALNATCTGPVFSYVWTQRQTGRRKWSD